MKHVHHDLIVSWAADLSRVVEEQVHEPCFDSYSWMKVDYPTWNSTKKYRFKPAEPKYIVVNGVNVPEPMRGGLEAGRVYWLASTAYDHSNVVWAGCSRDLRWLSLGLIHLTREAAQAHIDAMLLPSRSDK
jgi:hypothetical protein